jgi:uncharacterized protein (TIGR02646 family)
MRAITKGKEPTSLTKHRRTPHCDYANYGSDEKQELREALVQEQRGICCYCMARIAPVGDSMKIEHWQCQENYPARQLDYSNMLGACLGGEGQPGDKQHCDTRRGKKDLKFNPADPAHSIEQRVRFEIDGTITSSDGEFNAQLHELLGLNIPVLKNRRKAVVDGLAIWLRDYRTRHHRGPDVATLQRMRAKRVPSTGQLDPYVNVAVWWLDQRLPRSAT